MLPTLKKRMQGKAAGGKDRGRRRRVVDGSMWRAPKRELVLWLQVAFRNDG
jgi:hypothetical protein